MSELLISKKEGGVLTLTLNRPEVFNSINQELSELLVAELDAAQDDSEVRVVVLAASGKAFCAGQDLDEVKPIKGEVPNLGSVVDRQYTPLVLAIRELEKPVIAKVNGVAAGAGANLVFCCDFAVAAEEAIFIQAFSKVGLIPDTAGSFFVPRAVGIARATAMMMLAEKVSAVKACELGLIYKVVPLSDLDSTTAELAKTLSELPTKALGLTKCLLNESFSNSLEEQLALERESQHESGMTEDYAEGVLAFIEKRSPIFKGK